VTADVGGEHSPAVRLLEAYEGEPLPIRAVMPSGRHVPTRVRALVDHLAKRFAEM
jgi:DNA-binding transcriptional LysR family regulator